MIPCITYDERCSIPVFVRHEAVSLQSKARYHLLILIIPFLPSLTLLPAARTMSLPFPTNPTPSSPSNFQLIFNTAVEAYEKRTKRDLLTHPLALQLQKCDSPASIFAVLQSQVNDLEQARKGDERLTKWLGPTINVLITFSDTLGQGVSLV